MRLVSSLRQRVAHRGSRDKTATQAVPLKSFAIMPESLLRCAKEFIRRSGPILPFCVGLSPASRYDVLQSISRGGCL
jgi:hypothetical protein